MANFRKDSLRGSLIHLLYCQRENWVSAKDLAELVPGASGKSVWTYLSLFVKSGVLAKKPAYAGGPLQYRMTQYGINTYLHREDKFQKEEAQVKSTQDLIAMFNREIKDREKRITELRNVLTQESEALIRLRVLQADTAHALAWGKAPAVAAALAAEEIEAAALATREENATPRDYDGLPLGPDTLPRVPEIMREAAITGKSLSDFD